MGSWWKNRRKGLCQYVSFLVTVNAVSGDEVYSLVYHTQQELEPAAGETWHGMNFSLTLVCSRTKRTIGSSALQHLSLGLTVVT